MIRIKNERCKEKREKYCNTFDFSGKWITLNEESLKVNDEENIITGSSMAFTLITQHLLLNPPLVEAETSLSCQHHTILLPGPIQTPETDR